MKIAVIGAGITGNSAAWRLSQKYDVHLFEASSHLGGHAHTVTGTNYGPVDVGFIVYNEKTYPNFINLLDHFGIESSPSDMSFACSLPGYEYSSDSLFGQKSNLLSWPHWRMLIDLLRFFKRANRIDADPQSHNENLDDWLTRHKFSQSFKDKHIYPMAAAIWSAGVDSIKDFPAQLLARFFANHGLLEADIAKRPQWRTVKNGSQSYVRALTAPLEQQGRIHLKTALSAIKRTGQQIELIFSNGRTELFDQVVLAIPADQSLALLTDANDQEKRILSHFTFSQNTGILHRDPDLMPQRKNLWASWNVLQDHGEKPVLTYWMNRLQPFIEDNTPLFVTLNPNKPVKASLASFSYRHPAYTHDTLKGWDQLKDIQGQNGLWYCGAWCGYGFHEDGLTAAMSVADALDAPPRPWSVADASPAGKTCTPGQKR